MTVPPEPASDPAAVLGPLGWSDHWAKAATTAQAASDRDGGVQPGRVIRHDGLTVTVAMTAGTRPLPVLATVDPQPVVGDWVLAGDAVTATLERTSLLRRRDPRREGEQAIAANVDLVAVVCGLDRPVKAGRLQRTVALAGDAGADALVVLTKADLSDDPEAVAREARAAHPGTEVVVTSAATGRGIEALRAAAADRTVVFVGESGAGKSSLANTLAGAEVAAVGTVRAGDAKGRHTTTARELHLLPGGGVLIDTPGIRAVGLWTDADAVAGTFTDIEELATGCRFSDCVHGGEPGCVVEAAVTAGTLAGARLDAWHDLRAEAEATERRTEARARRPRGRPPRR